MPSEEINIRSVAVKVMRSYDYCHFEVVLSTSIEPNVIDPQPDGIKVADDLRKAAARLADKAVEQYQIAKREVQRRFEHAAMRDYETQEAKRIREMNEGDRTVREQATLKAFDDKQWQARREYDYEDQWEENE